MSFIDPANDEWVRAQFARIRKRCVYCGKSDDLHEFADGFKGPTLMCVPCFEEWEQ